MRTNETCAVARHRLTNGCLSFAARSIRIDPFVSSLLIRASATRNDSRAFEGKRIRTTVSEFDDCYMFSYARIEYNIARFEDKWNVRNEMEICSAVKGELI